jgi:hypothetical protein
MPIITTKSVSVTLNSNKDKEESDES